MNFLATDERNETVGIDAKRAGQSSQVPSEISPKYGGGQGRFVASVRPEILLAIRCGRRTTASDSRLSRRKSAASGKDSCAVALTATSALAWPARQPVRSAAQYKSAGGNRPGAECHCGSALARVLPRRMSIDSSNESCQIPVM